MFVQVEQQPDPVREVPLLTEGMAALDAIDQEMGLAFDDWDKKYYHNMFTCAPRSLSTLSRPLPRAHVRTRALGSSAARFRGLGRLQHQLASGAPGTVCTDQRRAAA